MKQVVPYIVILISMVTCVIPLNIPETKGKFIDCQKSKIDYNVTLVAGHQAGSFLKANKSITTMKRCLKQCCKTKGCDVAYFSNGACYSVKCKAIDSCVPIMNTDKRMTVAISYVAKPKGLFTPVSDDSNAEVEVTDNLIVEGTQEESPYSFNKEEEDGKNLKRFKRDTWKDTKDVAIAIGCGFVAVVVGVAGVIVMTRQLIEDDDTYPYANKIVSNIKNTLPTINENEELITSGEEEEEHKNDIIKENTKTLNNTTERNHDIP